MLASILALYDYDPEIFQDLYLPKISDLSNVYDIIDNPPELNKDLLIDKILMDCAELTLVYPDPEILKRQIRIWCLTNFKNWTDLYGTMLYKYNPIWNKDGSYTDERILNRSDRGSASSQGSNQMNGDIRDNVTGYDTNAYSPNTQQVSDNSGSFNQSGSTADSRDEAEVIKHTEAGNIGVTTTQQMIKEQREVVEFNIYDFITQSFKRQFCVLVY